MLDELTSDEYLTFERRNLADVFAPARKWGVMAFDYVRENKNLSWYSGIFRDAGTDSSFIERSNRDDYAWASRIAWTPYYDEPSDGRYLIHMGADYIYSGTGGSLTNPADQKAYNVSPEALTLNPFISTGSVNAENYDAYNLEFALMDGPFNVTAEATWVDLIGVQGQGTNTTDHYRGAYIEASYFLTGENRGYDREFKRFSAVKPYEPFFRVHTCDGICWGKGAWQVAARYSYVDFNNGAFNPGQENNYTLGLNWYLNQYCRMWFDYVHCDLSAHSPLSSPYRTDTVANFYETRFSYAF